jgi:hypothetical protein
MGYIGLPVLKIRRVWLNEAIRAGSAPSIAPSRKRELASPSRI